MMNLKAHISACNCLLFASPFLCVRSIENAVSEPFLDENTDGRTSDDPPKPTGLKAMKHSFVFGCAIGTVIINILIMIGASTATIIAGIVALIVSLTVAGSEMKLENLDSK